MHKKTTNTIKAKKEVVLVFDSLRDPRDAAEVIHLGLAAGVKIILSGSSLSPTHPKVLNILNSWLPNSLESHKLGHVTYGEDLSKAINDLKKKKFSVVGTSPQGSKSLFNYKFNSGKVALVFGTETSGLSREKMALMDEMLSIKMKNGTKFFTIRAVAPVFAYEAMRQLKLI